MLFLSTIKSKFISIFLIAILFFISFSVGGYYSTVISTGSYLSHTLHGKLTGGDAVSDSTVYDVYGTDLGIIVKHNNKYHYIFGDTFGNKSGLNWRSNTMAYSTDTDPSDGITIDGWIPSPLNGFAGELISSLKIDYIEMTSIPTAALSYDGNMYIFYMSVRHWGSTGGYWQCNNASIAVSVDNGYNFAKMSNISWAGTSNFVQFAFVQNQGLLNVSDNHFYFLATPAGRYGACYLSRVDRDSLLNQSAFEYYTGTDLATNPIWSNDHSVAVSIFPADVGELSVMWNDYLQKWTAFYFDSGDLDIVVRTSDNLWGPWDAPSLIVGAAEYPSLYGSYVHPDFVENSGKEVYFIMSKFDVYNTFVLSVDLNFTGSSTSVASFSSLEVTFSTLLLCGFLISIIVRRRKTSA